MGRYWNSRVGGVPCVLASLSHSGLGYQIDKLGSWVMSANLASSGSGTIIQHGAMIRNPKGVQLGSDVRIGRKFVIGGKIHTGCLRVGDGSQIYSGCSFDSSGSRTIGIAGVISEGCNLFTHSHGLEPGSKPIPSELHVEDHVWISARSIVLPSV